MVARIQLLRSATAGSRPTGKQYGETYLNFADNQFGAFDSTNAARDLLGVPVFSATTTYAAGNAVNYQGAIYIANGAVAAGAWNAAQWTRVYATNIRYDAAQSLTTPQQAVALRNISATQLNLINGKLVETHAANAATFTIQTLAGAAPSATDPVGCRFPDGSVVWITTALSLTITAGATLGTLAARPFRLWFSLINSAGTAILGVRNCTSLTSANQYNIVGFPSTRRDGATIPFGNSNLTTYGSAAGNGPYSIIAYADYNAGLATGGQWAVSPNLINLTSNNSPLPGDEVQLFTNSMTAPSAGITSTTYVASSVTCGVQAWMSPVNLSRISAQFDCEFASAVANSFINYQLQRMPAGTVLIGAAVAYCTYATEYQIVTTAFDFLDTPPAGQITYTIYYSISAVGAGTAYLPVYYGYIRVAEVMA